MRGFSREHNFHTAQLQLYMDEFLESLKLKGDIKKYVEIFADNGMDDFDSLLMEEPSLEKLEEMGISNSNDRLLIWKAVHPELVATAGAETTNQLDDSEIVLELIKDQIANKNLALVQELVEENKFNINFSDKEGNTLLHWAVLNNSASITSYLISKGASILPNKKGATPAHLAVGLQQQDASYQEVLNLLLKKLKS